MLRYGTNANISTSVRKMNVSSSVMLIIKFECNIISNVPARMSRNLRVNNVSETGVVKRISLNN